MKCPDCNGTGEIEKSVYVNGEFYGDCPIVCPDCKGTGEVEDDNDNETYWQQWNRIQYGKIVEDQGEDEYEHHARPFSGEQSDYQIFRDEFTDQDIIL